MFRRLVIRVLCAGAMVMVVATVCLAVVLCLAFSTPGYYAARASVQPSEDQVDAAGERILEIREHFNRWLGKSLLQQQRAAVASVWKGLSGEETDNGYDPDRDVHTLRISEADLNALLASDDFSAGQISKPRIVVTPGVVTLAVSLDTPARSAVLSASFTPLPPAGEEVRLRIANAKLGRLPLPLSALTKLLPNEVSRLQGDLYLDATQPLPELVLRPSGDIEQKPRVRSVQVNNGEIVLKLAAPAALK